MPKLFVLDTNVILHDARCLFQFQEHDWPQLWNAKVSFCTFFWLDQSDRSVTGILEEERLEITPLAYIRGRRLQQTFLSLMKLSDPALVSVDGSVGERHR
ncbi:MAG: hypothetical protein R3C59_24765 [Planctomycetaceae bacterium]